MILIYYNNKNTETKKYTTTSALCFKEWQTEYKKVEYTRTYETKRKKSTSLHHNVILNIT